MLVVPVQGACSVSTRRLWHQYKVLCTDACARMCKLAHKTTNCKSQFFLMIKNLKNLTRYRKLAVAHQTISVRESRECAGDRS